MDASKKRQRDAQTWSASLSHSPRTCGCICPPFTCSWHAGIWLPHKKRQSHHQQLNCQSAGTPPTPKGSRDPRGGAHAPAPDTRRASENNKQQIMAGPTRSNSAHRAFFQPGPACDPIARCCDSVNVTNFNSMGRASKSPRPLIPPARPPADRTTLSGAMAVRFGAAAARSRRRGRRGGALRLHGGLPGRGPRRAGV